jgi:hypothetical protein
MTGLGSEIFFQPLLGTGTLPKGLTTFPQANSDLKSCFRLFLLLLHKNE